MIVTPVEIANSYLSTHDASVTAYLQINSSQNIIQSILLLNQIIKNNLKVMDLSAVEMLKDKDIDVRVFNASKPENFIKAARGEEIGTTIKKG